MLTTRRPILIAALAAAGLALALMASAAAAAESPAAVESPAATGSTSATDTASAGATGGLSASAAATVTATPSAVATPSGSAREISVRRELTPEEIQKMPIFNRLDMDFKKGDKLLEDVKDNAFGYDESAFYYLVEKALKHPDLLARPDDEPVAFDTLMSMPSSYRGTAVTVTGLYMKVLPFAPPPIAIWKDVKQLYQCELRELPDDGVERPYATVIVIEDPTAYLHVKDPVRVKGFFLKVLQYRYQSGKGTGSAPMIVARRLESWEAPEGVVDAAASESSSEKWTLAIGFGVMALLAGGFITARQLTRNKPNAGKRPVYNFHIRRPDRPLPPELRGPGDKPSGPKP